MNESQNGAQNGSQDGAQNESHAESQVARGRKPQFRVCRVCAVLVPLAVVMTAGFLGWGYFEVPDRIERWLRPPLAPVTGRVLLNRAPLKDALVYTLPVNMKRVITMGVTDAEGRFTLSTDVDGRWVPGAYVGKNLVRVEGADPNVPIGPFKPPLITPPDCAEFDTTPLGMEVSRDPENNHFDFSLEYKVERPKAGPGSGAKRGGGGAFGAGPPGKPKGPAGKGKVIPKPEPRQEKPTMPNDGDKKQP